MTSFADSGPRFLGRDPRRVRRRSGVVVIMVVIVGKGIFRVVKIRAAHPREFFLVGTDADDYIMIRITIATVLLAVTILTMALAGLVFHRGRRQIGSSETPADDPSPLEPAVTMPPVSNGATA